jgi:hypothetical protein
LKLALIPRYVWAIGNRHPGAGLLVNDFWGDRIFFINSNGIEKLNIYASDLDMLRDWRN